MHRRLVCVAVAGAGLAAMASLGLAGGTAQAETAGYSAARSAPGGPGWWLSDWQMPQKVWPLSQGSGVTVAVIGRGVLAGLPDLRGVVRPGLDLTGHRTKGDMDLAAGSDGDGTAVSLLIAGQGYQAGTVGIAPKAKILPVALPVAGRLTGDEVAEAVRFAVGQGAQVIDLSFGVPVASASACDPVEQGAFAYALEHNIVLVAGAGDTASSGLRPVNPATCAGVLAVGGVEPDGTGWPGSARQPYVAVAAPGDHLPYVGRDGRFTMKGSGTALSAALVSGTAALVVSRYPDMPWYQVDQRIIDTAAPMGNPVPNDAFGSGIVDPARAVNATAYPVGSAGLDPVYTRFKAWLTAASEALAAQNGGAGPGGIAPDGTGQAGTGPAGTGPGSSGGQLARSVAETRAVAANGQLSESNPTMGRVVLVAVAVAAVGAFTVLQIMAWSGHRALRARRRSRRRFG
jgi:hypothetical protein